MFGEFGLPAGEQGKEPQAGSGESWFQVRGPWQVTSLDLRGLLRPSQPTHSALMWMPTRRERRALQNTT